MKKENPYNQKYADQEFYWGKEPSSMCDRVIEMMRPSAGFRPRLLDLGCGEGRDVVYFAQHGFEVAGLDLSLPGLEKTRRYAEKVGVHVETIHADVVDYELEDTYDVIFSTGTLQYLPPEMRHQRFENYKARTSPDGINALSVFVKKPFIPPAPDSEATAHSYRSGELMGYYWDWEILYCAEEIFDCMSSGIPHKHAINRIIARRYRDGKDLARLRLKPTS
jgi:tellurite methyltransferase